MYLVGILIMYQVEMLVCTKWSVEFVPVEFVPIGNVDYGYHVGMLNMYRVGILNMYQVEMLNMYQLEYGFRL